MSNQSPARQHVNVLRHREAKGRESDDADHAEEIEQQDQTESGPRGRGRDARFRRAIELWRSVVETVECEMLSRNPRTTTEQVTRQLLEPGRV